MLIPDNRLQTHRDLDSTQHSVERGLRTESQEILQDVLSGDYHAALEHLSVLPPDGLSKNMLEKLKRVFVAFTSFQQDFQEHDPSILNTGKLDVNATIDRFEAVLYDMGDVAEEYDDANTRIYLTIMAERLLQMAKLFQDEHINNRMVMSMPSSLSNTASRVNLLNQIFFLSC
ncbi:hypothetical protein BC943DRAFT_7097 [Umbelopsis sp. AD052]|nr:hypothetical protein BC943DRAFT_7097 [Umbelopsis sp. AD052]